MKKHMLPTLWKLKKLSNAIMSFLCMSASGAAYPSTGGNKKLEELSPMSKGRQLMKKPP